MPGPGIAPPLNLGVHELNWLFKLGTSSFGFSMNHVWPFEHARGGGKNKQLAKRSAGGFLKDRNLENFALQGGVSEATYLRVVHLEGSLQVQAGGQNHNS